MLKSTSEFCAALLGFLIAAGGPTACSESPSPASHSTGGSSNGGGSAADATSTAVGRVTVAMSEASAEFSMNAGTTRVDEVSERELPPQHIAETVVSDPARRPALDRTARQRVKAPVPSIGSAAPNLS